MSPALVMWAWIVGLLLALSGVLAYSGLATSVNRSGGEYRFLSDVLHPLLGVMAGWTSLFVGFSAPLAISAIALGAFGRTIGVAGDERTLATCALLLLLALHSVALRTSVRGQDLLVLLKVVLIAGLIAVGLLCGERTLPDWSPPPDSGGDSLSHFVAAQYWIAFSFSGWNAAIYCIDEFRDPERDVARAMFWGCLAVGLVYLLVNWVFVANITPEDGAVVFTYEEDGVTLAHVLMKKVMGGQAGAVVSGLIMVALFSSMSAMTCVGPRVYSEMAKDGFLPGLFAGKEGRPPTVSVFLQTGIALVLVFTQSLLTILETCAAALMFFSMLCCLANLLIPVVRKDLPAPSRLSRVGAVVYMVVATSILVRGTQMSGNAWALMGLASVILAFSCVGYAMKRSRLTR